MVLLEQAYLLGYIMTYYKNIDGQRYPGLFLLSGFEMTVYYLTKDADSAINKLTFNERSIKWAQGSQ